MQFDEIVHTKEFLLTNTDKLGHLAINSIEFAQSELAQDFDILSTPTSGGETVAHLLAMRSEWLVTPAGHDLNVLSLSESDHGFTVAHTIKSAQWIELNLAKSFGSILNEVLLLKNKSGNTVAHYGMPITEIFKLDQSKHILMIDTPDYATVAQANLRFELVNFKDLVLHLIEKGAAFNYRRIPDKGIYRVHNGDVVLLARRVDEMIEDENDPVLKLKKMIAAYSTIKNLGDTIFSITRLVDEDNKAKEELSARLMASIQEAFLGGNFSAENIDCFKDYNCEPGIDVLLKCLAETEFSNIKNEIDATSIDTAPKGMTLY
jgi:hypothetical protein